MSNVILISGDQDDVIRRKTQEAITEKTGGQADDFSLEVIKETEESSPISLLVDLINAIQTPPFFGQKTVCLQQYPFFAKEGPKTDKGAFSTQCRKLASLIEEGIDPNINLILSGPGIDKRKSIAKAIDKKGLLIICEAVKLTDRQWEAKVSQKITKQFQKKKEKSFNFFKRTI